MAPPRYGVGGKSATQLQVVYRNLMSNFVSMPVDTAA